MEAVVDMTHNHLDMRNKFHLHYMRHLHNRRLVESTIHNHLDMTNKTLQNHRNYLHKSMQVLVLDMPHNQQDMMYTFLHHYKSNHHNRLMVVGAVVEHTIHNL